jgi:hypothetical protein
VENTHTHTYIKSKEQQQQQQGKEQDNVNCFVYRISRTDSVLLLLLLLLLEVPLLFFPGVYRQRWGVWRWETNAVRNEGRPPALHNVYYIATDFLCYSWRI